MTGEFSVGVIYFSRRAWFFSCVVVLMAFSLLGTFSVQAEEAAVLETIVVQSEQEEQTLKDEQASIPGATTIIDGEKQYQRAVNNLADTFRYAPSMWAQSLVVVIRFSFRAVAPIWMPPITTATA
jgi:outer membrane receptor for ferrienterochelin and colicin